jgi:2-deoxy-D-gluconate 3-dehydrogenase
MSIIDAFRLDGKVAFVTGSNTGLGQGMALGFAQAGADVAGLTSSADDGGTAAAVEALGRRYHHLNVDLLEATDEELSALPQQVADALGRLDILLNNAGIIRRTPALDHAVDDWDAVLALNLRVPFILSQAAARLMMAQGGGKVINIASMLSYQGGITVPGYTASKHGIAGITKALANEWAEHHINVNAIAPGYMATNNTAALRADPTRNEAILARIPAGEWGTPKSLQGAAVFLASAASDYVHGAVLNVDGGWLAR